MMRYLRLIAIAAALWCRLALPSLASQATLVTPGSPLSMTGLASFLNAAFLSIGSCNSGNVAPTNGTGGAAFAGECWINTTANPWVFSYTADGTHWSEFGTLNTSSFVWTPYSNGFSASLGGNLSTAAAFSQAGAFATTLTATGITNATLPAGTHTLAGLDVSQTFSGTDNFTGTFQVGGNTMTFPSVAATLAYLAGNQTFTGTNNFTGTFEIGGTAQSFPGSGNLVGTSDSQTLTNKTFNCASNACTVRLGSDVTGTLLAASFPALTGDVTTTAGSLATTLATVNSNVGTFGSATAIPQVAFDGKGRATAVTTVAVNPFAQVASPTNGAIYKGQGASAPVASALTDDGSKVSSSAPVDLTNQTLVVEISNAGTTGTTVNALAKLTGAPSTAVIAATTDTGGLVGIVVGGAGTSGKALVAIQGQTSCAFDGATTSGDYFQASSSTGGDCHDIGASYPSTGQALGRVLSTNVGAGTYAALIFAPEMRGGTGGGGGVTSVDITGAGGATTSGTCNSTSSINCVVKGPLTEPQGRLTLTANTPIMTTSATAQTTLRYDCYIGGQIPYFTGTADALDTITSCEVTDALVSAAGAGQVVSGNIYDVWWEGNTHHNICLAMSSATGGGGGWSSDTGGSNTSRGTGYTQLDNITRTYTTNKNVISNCFNGATNYGSAPANELTYLGTVYASGNGQISYTFGAGAAGCTAALFGVWNAYNRVNVSTLVFDTTSSWTYAVASTWRPADASTNCRISFVRGTNEDSVDATYHGIAVAGSSTFAIAGVGMDSTTAFTGVTGPIQPFSFSFAADGHYSGIPGAGLHFVQAIEYNAGSSASTWQGNNGTVYLQSGFWASLRQ